MLASVHGFYDFHMRLGAIAEQPLYQFLSHTPRRYKPFLYGIAKIKPIQTRVVKVKRERHRVKTLTQDQVDQLIAACSHIRDKFLLTLLYQTGMRIGQVLGLGVPTFFTPKIPAKPFLYWGKSGKRSNSGKATSEKSSLLSIEELFTGKMHALLVHRRGSSR